MKLYTGGKQYASKDELWDSILQSAQSIGAEEIENLTKSVDNRLVKVLSNNGNHVNMQLHEILQYAMAYGVTIDSNSLNVAKFECAFSMQFY